MVDAAAADGEISPPPSTDGASGLLRRLSVSSLQFLFRLGDASKQNRAIVAMPMPDVLRRKVLAAGARCASLRICTQGNVVECAPGQPRPYTYDASSRELSRGFSGEEGNEEEGSNDENVPPATDLHDSNDRHELARTRAGKPGTQSPLRSLVSDCPQTRSSPSLLPSVHVDLQGPFNSRFLLPQPHPSKDNKLCVVLDIDETLVCGYSANAVPRHMQEDSRVGYRLRAFNLHCAVGEDASLYADKSLTERGLASESASGAITAVASSTGDGGGDAAAEHISITVFERPGLAAFLHELERFAEVIVFTAGVQGYARPLTDAIDPEGYITGRLYRDACVSTRYSDHVKDLLRIGRDLRKTVLVDNNPLSFLLQPHNGVPAVPFTGDPNDAYLETHLMPVLQDLAVAVEGGKDVRPILAGRFHMAEWFQQRGIDLKAEEACPGWELPRQNRQAGLSRGSSIARCDFPHVNDHDHDNCVL